LIGLIYFLPYIRADYHKLDTAAWRVASRLQYTKRVNIKLGVPIGNAVDPISSLHSIASLVGTQVENSAALCFIRENLHGAKRTTGVSVAKNYVATL
jgi:hypothetical protein